MNNLERMSQRFPEEEYSGGGPVFVPPKEESTPQKIYQEVISSFKTVKNYLVDLKKRAPYLIKGTK